MAILRIGHGEVAEGAVRQKAESPDPSSRATGLQLRAEFVNASLRTPEGWPRGDEANERVSFVWAYRSKLAC